MLEKRLTTKIVPEVKCINLADRLTFPEKKREQGTVEEMFKIISGIELSDPYVFINKTEHKRLRCRGSIIKVSRSILNIRKFSFNNTVVVRQEKNTWKVVLPANVNYFKKNYDDYNTSAKPVLQGHA